MLDVLIAFYPEALTRDELAQRVGYEVAGGTFNTYLSALRRNGLPDITGHRPRQRRQSCNTSAPRFRRWVTALPPGKPRAGHSAVVCEPDRPSYLQLPVTQ